MSILAPTRPRHPDPTALPSGRHHRGQVRRHRQRSQPREGRPPSGSAVETKAASKAVRRISLGGKWLPGRTKNFRGRLRATSNLMSSICPHAVPIYLCIPLTFNESQTPKCKQAQDGNKADESNACSAHGFRTHLRFNPWDHRKSHVKNG